MAPNSVHRAGASFALPPSSQPLALITGDGGDNVLAGTSGADLIDGLGGHDRIEGRGGLDTLNGGEGNDVITDYLNNVVDGGAGDDLIVNLFVSGGTWAGGLGNDTIDFSNDAFDATINLAAASFLILGARFSGFENAIGSQGNERIAGTAGDNFIDGQAGDDSITGGEGYDTLYGGAGNDRITDGGDNVVNGGEGNDVIKNTHVDGGIWDGGAGIDKIDFTGNSFSSITIDLRNPYFVINGAVFRGFENVVGSGGVEHIIGSDGANLLNGAAGNDRLTGGGGDDTLDGGAGVDTMRGGLGNDVYHLDVYADQVIEAAGQGIDTIYSRSNRTLPAHVENMILQGVAVTGNGNELDNVITGNALDNILRGYGGADTLIGGAGNDQLYGGTAGAGFNVNVLRGGTGDDVYYIDGGSIVEELPGEGTDQIVSSSSISLSGNNASSFSNVENATLTGSLNEQVTGNALANRLAGNSGNNFLSGLDGADTLIGGAGADTLDGGAGADQMSGGSGDDQYIVDNLGDTITEAAGGGRDQVISSVDIVLPDNVEDLILSGSDYSSYLRGEGNSLNNIIVADANSTVLGHGGDDVITVQSISVPPGDYALTRLDGGAGRDTYYFVPDVNNDFAHTIVLGPVSDSTGMTRDLVVGMQLGAGQRADRFDVPIVPVSIAAKITTGIVNGATLDADIAAAVGAAQLGANQAVLFDPSGGTFGMPGVQYVIIDANGVAGYQSGEDYLIQLNNARADLTLENFI